ncbi:MAG: DUF2341 domain-containing protein [Desulfurococcaceae archaeon]
MANVPVSHLIGTLVIIAMVIGISYHVFSTLEYNMVENYRRVLDSIATFIASELSKMVFSGENLTTMVLNHPIEAYSKKGYNVYVGSGVELNRLFSLVPVTNDLYVVVSSPDNKVYSYKLLAPFSYEHYNALRIGEGYFIKVFSQEGYSPIEAYYEEGVVWVCRVNVTITDNSGVDLVEYPVPVEFNPSALNCTYRGKTYHPRRDDVRFTDINGYVLDYWIETWSDTYAKVWVKIPSLRARSNVTIYMHWGNPLASEKSNPERVFRYYINFSALSNPSYLNQEWGVRNTTPYSLSIASSGLNIAASFRKSGNWNTSYVNLYSLSKYEVIDNGMGLIVEAYGSPQTSEDQDYRLALYDVSSITSVLVFNLKPVIANPMENGTLNYSTMWGYGTMDIENHSNYTALRVYANESLGYYYAGLLYTYFNKTSYPPGHEQGQLIIAVNPLKHDGNTYFGIIFFDCPGDRCLYSKAFGTLFNIQRINDTHMDLAIYNYIGDLIYAGDLRNWQIIESLRIPWNYREYPEYSWLYVYIYMGKTPGRAYPATNLTEISLYGGNYTNPDQPMARKEIGVGIGNFEPSRIGFMVLSSNNESSVYFDLLVAGRYGETPPDHRYIYFEGLQENWKISVYDTDINGSLVFVGSSQANETGVVSLPIINRPILGIYGPVYIIVSFSSGDYEHIIEGLVYNGELGYIAGGSVITLNIGLSSLNSLRGVAIHASRYNLTTNRKIDQIWSYLLIESAFINPKHISMGLRASTGILNYTAIGLFNNTVYFIIERNITRSDFNSNGSYIVVIGVSNGNCVNCELSAIYQWIRIRPFVYPEPDVRLGTPEHVKEERPPLLIFEIKPYVVFSSSMAVDFSIYIKGDKSEIVIVLIKRGVRGP